MKHGYKNPLVTYEEIVEALKAIIECSLNNNYMDDFDYLNLKYESESSVRYEGAEERALYKAVKSLEKTIDSANKIIKDNLEQNLRELELSRFTIHANYLIGQERRKLAASQSLVEKLANASIKLNTIFNISYEEEEKNTDIEPIKVDAKEILDDYLDEDNDDSDDDGYLDFSHKEEKDTNKEYSDFEKKVLINFPEFFKEELELAKKYSDDDEPIEADELFNTIELEPITMDYVACENIEDEEDDSDIILADDIVNTKSDDYDLDFVMPTLDKKSVPAKEELPMKDVVVEDTEEVKDYESENKKINKEKVLLIKRALDKAKSMHDERLVQTLKKQLAKELGVGK